MFLDALSIILAALFGWLSHQGKREQKRRRRFDQARTVRLERKVDAMQRMLEHEQAENEKLRAKIRKRLAGDEPQEE